MIIVGTAGLTLISLAILESQGIRINTSLVMIGLEVAKYGLIFYLLKLASALFL